MSASFVFYKKGKGHNKDGSSLASKYEAQKAAFLGLVQEANDGDPRAKSMLSRHISAAQGLRQKSLGPADVQGVPILNNLSIQYAPGDMIGMELFPVVPVDKISGNYFVYDKRDRLQKAKTKGRGNRGEANEANTRRTQAPYACEPDQLSRFIGLDTVLNQDAPLNELLDLVEDVNGDLALNREREQASLAGTTGNYASGNVQTLTAGAGRWDEAGSDIRKHLLNGMAKIWRGNGSSMLIGWTSLEVWNVVRTHPDHLSLLSLGDRGLVSPAQFCDIYGLDGLLVSDVRTDSANIAQSASYSRLWGNKFGVMRVSTTPQLRNASFGYTFRWTGRGNASVPGGFPGGVFSQMWYDQKEGTIGAYFYKRAHYEDRIIVANDTGFLWETPIAPF